MFSLESLRGRSRQTRSGTLRRLPGPRLPDMIGQREGYCMSLWRSATRVARAALAMMMVSLLLVACGGDDDDPTPTGVATRVPPSLPRPTDPAVASPVPASPVGGATPVAVPETLGAIGDRVNAAWANVRTYRTTTTTEVLPPTGSPVAASPAASPPGLASPVPAPIVGATPNSVVNLDEVVAPDRRRRLIVIDGQPAMEYVAVSGRVFERPAGGTWRELGPLEITDATAVGRLAIELSAPVTSPYVFLPPVTRALEAARLGPRQVGDQTCDAFGIASTTATGERVDTVIALAPTGLPCRIEYRAGGMVNTVVYEAYNLAITIDVPTPLGENGPLATPTDG